MALKEQYQQQKWAMERRKLPMKNQTNTIGQLEVLGTLLFSLANKDFNITHLFNAMQTA